jgi:hypothetical protein
MQREDGLGDEHCSLKMGGHQIDVRWDERSKSFSFNIHLSSGRSKTLRYDIPSEKENTELHQELPSSTQKRKERRGNEEDGSLCDGTPEYQQKVKKMKMDEQRN